MQLDSKARREIVDYITGKFPTIKGTTEPDLSHLLRRRLAATEGFGKWTKGAYAVDIPPPNEPGWGGRLTQKTFELLEEHVLNATEQHAVNWLTKFEGIGEKRAKDFLRKFSRKDIERVAKGATNPTSAYYSDFSPTQRLVGALSSEGSIITKIYGIAATALAEDALPEARPDDRVLGSTDEPVTADVKRLIRLPGSLHGKSGLKVVTLTRSTLDAFDPLKDAVAFPMDPVTIVPRNDQEMTLGGERVAVKKGEATPVPMAHAVFWLARQGGTIAQDRSA
jgi:DNA primase small subunit